MSKMKFGILFVIAAIALVSMASAALPAQVTATISHPGPASCWGVVVTTGSGDIPAVISPYTGWCADSQSSISTGSKVFNVYSSLVPVASLPAGLPTVQWKEVNYVLNNQAGADKETLQAVYWHYDGGPHTWGTVNWTKYNEIVTATDAYIALNPTYKPGPGENYAVILWNQIPGTKTTPQPIFIELPIPTIPSPEFPTFALPVAMLIGVVGAVHYVRGRKE